MPTLQPEQLTPLVFIVVALVAAAILLVLFVRVDEPAREEPRTPLITQHYAPGETVEQPTPYYVAPVPESPDPLEVSANTDRKALLAIALLFGLFAMMGAYYTLQTGIPVRAYAGTTLLDEAKEKQLDVSIERGANLYASLCFDCHGKRGQGDVGVGLPLNRPDNAYRASCGPNAQDENGKKCKQSDDDKTRTFLFNTIARGRAFAPPRYSMPAWSRAEGGQLNDEQINQLVSFIMYGNWDRILQLREQQGLALEPNPPARPVAANPAQTGQQVAQTTCVACHSFTPGTASANPAAPNLGHYASEGPFNDPLKALKGSGDPDWLKKWVSDAPSIKPGTGMPKWQGVLSDDQINGVVAYLMTLK
jgi:mono/diheme cytochrome c family protein